MIALFVVTLDTEEVEDGWTEKIDEIHNIAKSVYGEEALIAGDLASTEDLKDTITVDNTRVNLLAILFVFVILVVNFRSISLPIILTLVIELSIWINLSVPYFQSTTLHYIGYLIISSVQLGATIDYAILLTGRYLEERKTKTRYEVASLSENYQQFDAQIQTMPILLQNLISDQMTELKTAIDTLTTEYEKLDQGIGSYTEAVDEIQKGYAKLYSAYGQVTTAVGQLEKGARSAASGSNSLASGTQNLQSGADTLASGAGDLYDGTVELYDGVTELSDGTGELKDGTEEFKDKTSDMDTQIGLVQFAMKTNAIESKEEETEAETEATDNSILGKLKNLF